MHAWITSITITLGLVAASRSTAMCEVSPIAPIQSSRSTSSAVSTFVYRPRVHLAYIKIDHETFKITTKTCFGKTDTERFTFNMTYTAVQADLITS